MPAFTQNILYRTLADLEVINKKKLDEAHNSCNNNSEKFIEVLINQDLISDENLGKLIAEAMKVPFIALGKVTIRDVVLKTIPESAAKLNKAIAFSADDSALKVATS